MWGAVLFFLTIVMVTPLGRAVADELVRRIVVSLAMPVPYAHAGVAIMAFCALASMLLMRRRAPKRVEIRWVWYQVRGDPGESESDGGSTGRTR